MATCPPCRAHKEEMKRGFLSAPLSRTRAERTFYLRGVGAWGRCPLAHA
jgi:hypothetical protein